MEQSPTVKAAREFLSVVWEGERPADDALLAALDGLVEAYHHTPEAGPSDSDLEARDRTGQPSIRKSRRASLTMDIIRFLTRVLAGEPGSSNGG